METSSGMHCREVRDSIGATQTDTEAQLELLTTKVIAEATEIRQQMTDIKDGIRRLQERVAFPELIKLVEATEQEMKVFGFELLSHKKNFFAVIDLLEEVDVDVPPSIRQLVA